MKKLLLLCAMLFPGWASAEDYATVFSLSGGTIFEVTYTGMELDVTAHSRYLALNGALQTASGLASPVTGTCQFTSAGGVFCLMNMGRLTLILDLGANLNGVIRVQDQDGNSVTTVGVTFLGLE